MSRQFVRTVVSVAACAAIALGTMRVGMGQDGASSKEREKELLAVLRSDSPAADKALVCKNLAVHGSSEAVPDLARLLPDEQLSSWARIALEAIPGAEADEALLQASNAVEGRLLVGVINSLGVRRPAAAVAALTGRMQGADADVASAAAAALGRIGNADAATALRKALATAPAPVRSSVAEGCVLCAERFLSEGNATEAIAIYDEVRKADVARTRILEATRGAILARKDDGIPLLIEQLSATDKGLFQIALTTAREIPGNAVDKALASELDRIAPERAALVIGAMADRKGTVELTAIVKAASSSAQPVRLAAGRALGSVGDASCIPILLELALDSDAEITEIARRALAELPGNEVDTEIVARLSEAQGKTYGLLIEVIGQRRIAAVDALVKALDQADPSVRSAALTSLGNTIGANDLGVLIQQVTSPKHAEDLAVAQKALLTAAVRMSDREASAARIAGALDRSPVATQTVLLEILGAMGGTKALRTVGAAAKSSQPELQDVSSRLLGEWMTIDAAPVLLDLAKSAPSEKYQVRALRGYIRIARQFVMDEPERVAMCRSAMEASRQPAEQKLVLDVMKRYPSTPMLGLAMKAIDVPALKDHATQASLAIATKLGGDSKEVRELLTRIGLDRVKLEILKAEYGAGSTQKDVTDILRKQATDIAFVTLPSTSYNEAFGGDPAPGTVKQLKIQYRINGKTGEIALAENALIILPTPK